MYMGRESVKNPTGYTGISNYYYCNRSFVLTTSIQEKSFDFYFHV